MKTEEERHLVTDKGFEEDEGHEKVGNGRSEDDV